MWKKDNEPTPTPSPNSPTPAAPRYEPEAAPTPRSETSGRAVIGASIRIQGELAGGEDLLIEGRIEGTIELAQHALTVGAKGRIAGSAHARAIHVEGEVDGNLTADEALVLRKSARVKGDLSSPRVVIEDGARFKGSIDMETKRGATASLPASGPLTASGPRPLPAEDVKRPTDVKAG
jgi:cytoskeletal protein CcmA (bactofilin family)